MSKTGAIFQESRALMDSNVLLRTPVEELTDDVALTAWAVLDLFEKKLIKTRKAELHPILLQRARTLGEKDPKGSFVYEVPGTDGSVKAEKRRGKVTLDVDAVIDLLDEKVEDGSLTARVRDQIITYEPVVNAKKLEKLVAQDVISIKELTQVSSIEDPSFALKVEKPSKVMALLEKKNAQ